ncbi:NAD(P)-dependent oxidoreductase [Microterricola viridarii]|uniref:3-hydroxyisobutyrate dehydrogenase n=1 Tax=Microterricola viridarii TaxID=412690 RepID=A0A1H1QDW4_9MICO|nr:NAD(P)-dependent oxidoreductase [Microterricola viridarii]SDS21467.1 3-hydroxyisobutyrate dehydrogenase [Microterricola viridarii]
MSTITFVGIGAIGVPMARLLVGAGHDVTGVDPFEAARQRAEAAGVSAVASFAEAAPAELVIVMVATPAQLDELVGQAGDRAAGQSWVIMSTVGPDAVRAAAERLAAVGARVVDAPVTGGVARATTGELLVFASGRPELLASVTPALAVLGTVRAVGDRIGDGQAIKVVNQHLCSVHIVAAAEALNLAESLGLDSAEVLELIGGGAAGSWMLGDRGPRMLLDADVPVTSTVNIFVKDSGLVADAAAGSGADVPLLLHARQRFVDAAAAGLGLHDDSRVIEGYRRG